MDFTKNDKDSHQFNPELNKYTVPVTGWYHLAGRMVKMRPTGRYEQVTNRRYWFQFWKPKMISRQIYEIEETWEGTEIRMLQEGQSITIGSVIPPIRL